MNIVEQPEDGCRRQTGKGGTGMDRADHIDRTFVIPAFNEARRLPGTLAAIANFAATHAGNCEVIVADDGSTDSTVEVALEFQRLRHCLRVLRLPHRGKGFAVRRGVSVAAGDVVILCDADLHDGLLQAARLEQALARGADVAIGSRWVDHLECLHTQPLYRRVSSRIFNVVAGQILALPFRDTQCGLKALTREAAGRIFPRIRMDGWAYDLELIHIALSLGLQVKEVGVRLVHDYRESRFRPVADGWAACRELVEIRWNDLRGAYPREALSTVSVMDRAMSAPLPEEIKEDAA